MANPWIAYLVIFLNCFVIINGNSRRTPLLTIVNGYRCPIEVVPYMVSIRLTENFKHYCGGTILSELWIMTAAHCCRQGHNFTVVAGQSIITNDTASKYRRKVIESIMHNNHEDNDICLLRLDKPLLKSKSVQFAKLPTHQLNTSYLEEVCKEPLVAGWGVQYPKDVDNNPIVDPIPPHDPHLQCVKLNIFNTERCKKRFPFYVAPSIMCTLTKEKDACQGDSGGTLECNGIQYGLSSFGAGCAHRFFPGAYTRVDMYRHFIRSNILKDSRRKFRKWHRSPKRPGGMVGAKTICHNFKNKFV